MKLSVVVPAYNEATRLARSLPAFYTYLDGQDSVELILVNDGSTDSTLAVMRQAASSRSYVQVVSYDHNRGKGRAVATGVAATTGQNILVTDVDLSVPFSELSRLMARLGSNTGAVIASRVASGAQVSQPFYRTLGGRVLNLFIQALFLPGLRDTQCGFKLFEGDLARAIFASQRIDGFAFDVEVLWRIRRAGYRIAEVGVQWTHDADSRVLPLKHTAQILTDLIKLRFGLL
jgi:dolichyl-phosphate beta-glucosyltransferase